jgi:hypothetical protein
MAHVTRPAREGPCTALAMTTSIADFARATSSQIRTRTAFQARQTIHAHKIEVVARIRTLPGDRLVVEYTTYASQLAEMDDLLGGNAELARDDLEGASLYYDGRTTSWVSPKTATALRAPGRRLYEPIPGYDALGEIRFLDDLARDFLLRDGGEGNHGGRATRIVGLKPKRSHVSSLFRLVSFPVERAEVAFDTETFFPLRISFLPARDAVVGSILAPDPWIVVEYSDVSDPATGETTSPPGLPPGTRVFEETEVAGDQVQQMLPFRIRADVLRERGYELSDNLARVVLDETHEWGYAILVYVKPDDRGRPESVVSLRVGNYVSRLMARRRTLAGERGETVDVGGAAARCLDRRALLGAHPDARHLPALVDLVWERDAVFWVVTGEAVPQEELLPLAAALS